METEKEMLSRLNGMAKGSATWDLSENDMNAIGWALNIVEEKFTSHNKQSTPCLHRHHEHDMGSIICLDCNAVLPL
jgi:hypothetical protein